MPSRKSGKKKEHWIPTATKIIQNPDETPNLVVRCISGIMMDKQLTGDLRKQFEGAVAICCTGLRKSGRLDNKQPLDIMKLTSTGRTRDRERRKQKDQTKKKNHFNLLIRQLQKTQKDDSLSLKARKRGTTR